MKVEAVEDGSGKVYGYLVECPGCASAGVMGSGHIFTTQPSPGKPCWDFNGDLERPTFSPSMLARVTWGAKKEKHVCHSFVRDGQIQYLGDCTHELRGQTVPLPDIGKESGE